MKRAVVFLAISTILITGFTIKDHPSIKNTPLSVKLKKDDYKLVWADEFNTDGLVDASNWSFETGFVRNKEAQWYQEKNVWCEKGNLIIEGRRGHDPNPNYVAGSSDWKKSREFIDYTSGSIKTANKKSWKYGRFVMRARINTH